MRVIPHPDADQLQLADVLHALSDQVRLEIVWVLADGREVSCGSISVGISKSTLTHHLKVLRDAGLTQTRVQGVQRLVSLRRVDIDARFPGLLDLVLAYGPDAGMASGDRFGESAATAADVTLLAGAGSARHAVSPL